MSSTGAQVCFQLTVERSRDTDNGRDSQGEFHLSSGHEASPILGLQACHVLGKEWYFTYRLLGPVCSNAQGAKLDEPVLLSYAAIHLPLSGKPGF